MKTPTKKMIPQRSTPQVHHLVPTVPAQSTPPVPLDGGLDADTLFLLNVAKAGHLTAKDFQYGMRVNKTTSHSWFNGTKANPFKRAREGVDLFRQRGSLWVIPSILEYVAGSDFDGAVLPAEAREALMVLAKVVK